ncbi:MAG: hypothetical protein NVSMB27_24500 [Ktedonobacteraceae bacterium]
MQYFPRVSLQKSFLEVKMRAPFDLFPRQSACSVFRESTLSNTITETLGKLFIYTRNSTVSAGGDPPTVSTLLTQFAHSG